MFTVNKCSLTPLMRVPTFLFFSPHWAASVSGEASVCNLSITSYARFKEKGCTGCGQARNTDGSSLTKD